MEKFFLTTNSLSKDEICEACSKNQLSCSTSINTHIQRNEPEIATYIMSYVGQISCILIAEFIKEFIIKWKEKKKKEKSILIKLTPNEEIINIPEDVTLEQLKQITKIVKELKKDITQIIIINN